MKRIEQVPVGETEEAGGVEEGGLPDLGPARDRHGLELQPGAAGNSHLGAQPQQAIGLEGLDAPEVEGVARAELVGAAPPAAQADASAEQVQGSAQSPEEIAVVPAGVAADAPDR